MVVTETWITDPQDFKHLNISEYTCEFYTRKDKPGRGIAVFISNNFSYKIVEKIVFTEAESVLWKFSVRKVVF